MTATSLVTPEAAEDSKGSAKVLSKVVVVHGGARDSYQLALALSETGMLDTLVTDLFWPEERAWARWINLKLPHVRQMVMKRSATGLPSYEVTQHIGQGLRGLLLDKLPRIPLSFRRRSIRAADAALGRAAGKRARETGSGLVTYSYFGYDAMREYGRPAMLFQVHPHPATIRKILLKELEDHPDCSASLQQEWELALPDREFQHLVDEPAMASQFLVASTFTRDSLVEHGISSQAITVIPYGVDLERFCPAATPAAQRPAVVPEDSRLHLLFVGRINQRKGIKYLLEALRLLDTDQVHLTICGRVVDDLELFKPFGTQIDIRPSVSAEDLVKAYQQADLFVFPSVAEGFGQVLLEALACGLPLLSTTHTAAPDLIEDGEQGFIIEPRRPDLLAQRITWAMTHRAELAEMRSKARQRAEQFTWQRFRQSAAAAVGNYLATRSLEPAS